MDSPWVQTYCGVAFDLLNPEPEQVKLLDIAHHLSRVARFNGATTGDYGWSAAQHSLLAEALLPDGASDRLRLHVLLHDARETYVNDMTSPVYHALNALADGRFSRIWHELVSGIDRAIWRHFDLPEPDPEEAAAIKKVDLLALLFERDSLMHRPAPKEWGIFEPEDYPRLPKPVLTALPPDAAQEAFHDWVTATYNDYKSQSSSKLFR